MVMVPLTGLGQDMQRRCDVLRISCAGREDRESRRDAASIF
jgi:hypothetical protein